MYLGCSRDTYKLLDLHDNRFTIAKFIYIVYNEENAAKYINFYIHITYKLEK